MTHPRVNRRTALRTLATAGIGAAAAPLWIGTLTALAREQAAHVHPASPATASAGPWTPKVLSARQDETVTALCELIIPETDTPGAKAALVNRIIDLALASAPPADRATFLAGLAWMDARSTALFATDVRSAAPGQQTDLLTRLSSEIGGATEDKTGTDFFAALKSMTIAAYYTTPIGLRQELGDDGQLVLAEFKGCEHPEHQ